MRLFTKLLVRLFFRRVEVVGAEQLADGRPMVLVANHQNGLVDAVLLMATLPRFPRFLAKSTLFSIPPLWPLLKLARVVPVHRSEDGATRGRNAGSFRRSRAIVGSGGLLAVFPEGVSHDQPALRPLHTGAARIALESAFDDGADTVETVVVALVYDDKARFRSRALVRVGTPEDMSAWCLPYRHDGPEAVRGLTADLADRLRQLGPDYETWWEADLLAWIADVVARPVDGVLPVDVRLADRQRITDGLAVAEQRYGRYASMDALRDASAAYQRDLDLLGLTDAQVAARFGSGRLPLVLAAALAKVAVTLPFAIAGAAIHLVPYMGVKWLARAPHNESIRSTVKVLGCLITFPLLYAAVGVAVGLQAGPLAGGLAALAAPVCGYIAVRTAERVGRIEVGLDGARFARRGGGLATSVLANRQAVVTAAVELLDMPTDGRPSGSVGQGLGSA